MIGGDGIGGVVFACLFLGIPQFAYQIQFANQADTVSIGMFACVSSIFLIDKWLESNKNHLLLLASCLLLVLALSIYQTIITYAFAIALSCVLRNCFKKNHDTKSIIFLGMLYAIVFILAMIIFFIMQKFVAEIFNIPDQSQKYANAVTHWGKRTNEAIYITIWSFIYNSFTGRLNYGLNAFCLVLIPSAWLILTSFKQGLAKSIIIVASVLSLLLSPFILLFYFGSIQYPRTLFALPVVFSAITFLALNSLKTNFPKFVLMGVLLASSASSVSSLFYSDAVSRQHDFTIMNKVYSDISSEYSEYLHSPKRVFFYGAIKNNNPWIKINSDTFGASYFSWDGGNNLRIRALFDYYGLAKFNTAKKEEVVLFEGDIKKMRQFPQHGYIKEINGILIIRLGDKVGAR